MQTIQIENGFKKVQIDQHAYGFFLVARSEKTLGGWYQHVSGKESYDSLTKAEQAARKWVAK